MAGLHLLTVFAQGIPISPLQVLSPARIRFQQFPSSQMKLNDNIAGKQIWRSQDRQRHGFYCAKAVLNTACNRTIPEIFCSHTTLSIAVVMNA
jgi:hypothetical protein